MKFLDLSLRELLKAYDQSKRKTQSKVDAIEIQNVVGYDEEGNQVLNYEDATIMEPATGDEDDTAIINGVYLCFSVYVHRTGSGVTCIADFETAPEAEAFAKQLGSILGVPITHGY